MITVEIEGDFLNFMRDGHVFFMTRLYPRNPEIGRFFRHMDDKAWFAEVRAECLYAMIAGYHGSGSDPTHDALLSHASVRGVTCCHPMSGRYCAVGRSCGSSTAECVRDGGKEAMQWVRRSRRNGRMKSRSGR